MKKIIAILLLFSHNALSLPGDGKLVATPYIKGTIYNQMGAYQEAVSVFKIINTPADIICPRLPTITPPSVLV
jgi:hypothetical protein